MIIVADKREAQPMGYTPHEVASPRAVGPSGRTWLDRVEDMRDELITTLPQGFVWGAVKAGIKASGKMDLAAAVPVKGATAAAMFTKNQVVAAPVTVGRKHLLATGG